jgi:hypothetical protein
MSEVGCDTRTTIARPNQRLSVSIIAIVDILADVSAQPAPCCCKSLHALDMLLACTGVRVSIGRARPELDKDIVSTDLVARDAGVAAEIQVALH